MHRSKRFTRPSRSTMVGQKARQKAVVMLMRPLRESFSGITEPMSPNASKMGSVCHRMLAGVMPLGACVSRMLLKLPTVAAKTTPTAAGSVAGF